MRLVYSSARPLFAAMPVRIRLARFGRKVRCALVTLREFLLNLLPCRPPPRCRLLPSSRSVLTSCTALRTSHQCQNLPFYRIFVADSRCPRDGRHLEQVGHYDPIPGERQAAGTAAAAALSARLLGCPCPCRSAFLMRCCHVPPHSRAQPRTATSTSASTLTASSTG